MLDNVLKSQAGTMADNNNRLILSIIVVLAVLYNAILAFVNINITPMAVQHVAITEIFIVLLATGYLLLNLKFIPNLLPHLIFLFITMSLSAVVMLANNEIFIKIIRDMYLIVLFVLLGTLMDRRSIITVFKILTVITLCVILIEVFKSDLYIALFHPASYYENTRGIVPFGNSGFFRNAIAPESRFSFNFISDVRTSSVFLEQVSLANFSMLLMIFIASFWKYLNKKEVLFFGFSILFFILTNDSRTGSLLTIAILVGYFVFPKLPAKLYMLIIPSVIITSIILFYDPSMADEMVKDNIAGRISLTVNKLADIDFKIAFLGQLGEAINKVYDSGYAYIIYAMTLWGLVMFWGYVCYILPSKNCDETKRFAFSVSLFIAVNLMIGAAIFTIKVSAPLWIMAGYYYNQTCKNILTKQSRPLLKTEK